jgi:hypothetical protein
MINNNNHNYNLHTTAAATPQPTITSRNDEKFRRRSRNERRAMFHGSKIKHAEGQSDLYIKRSFHAL